MRLVYLSPVPWASFAQRPQKFVRWFHEKTGGDVLWLEPYPSRFPRPEDFKKIAVSDKTENDERQPWLTVLKPTALPIEPLPASGLINGLFWYELLSVIKEFSHDQQILLVIGKPTVLALQVLKQLKGCTSVYDAMDDFPTFYSGMSKKAMARRELEVGNKVSYIFTSSTNLRKKWEQHKLKIKFVPNGLDATLLPTAKTQYGMGESKIFGYVGTVGSWFDWKWMIHLAESHPNDQVHIVGPIFNRCGLTLPANLKLFPPCSHKDALIRMLSFDIAVIPFLKNDLTASVDPIKYYEYRALGLPVLSTSFGEMLYKGEQDGVYLCDSPAEITQAVNSALTYKTTVDYSEKFKLDNSWEARFDSTELFD